MDYERAFARIVEQHALGPRFVGSDGHSRLEELLGQWLSGADWLREHRFVEPFFGVDTTCRTFWARFHGERPGRMLLGSHYDTRPWADRDPNPACRRDPVPGANDGGSGIALLSELALTLREQRERPTVDLVFFDAEDWHDIDGKQVSLGARRFVADLAAGERPDTVIIVDMVGGRDLVLDFDVSVQDHPPSLDLATRLRRTGRRLGLPAFRLEEKREPYKWIGCDHSPFVAAGIPSTILIDIDYPPWHTVADVPAACEPGSLRQIGRLLESVVFAS